MKIFVQIASYRDADLVNTINDLLNNAKYPENITFGICHQYGKESWDQPDIFYNIDCELRLIHIPYSASKGACWARNLTQSLYRDEPFTLQIDSHTRSEPFWDEKILKLYYSFDHKKIILSTYPSMFTPDQTYNEYNKNIYSCHIYTMKNGFISARPRELENISKPMKAVGIAAGFIFGPGSIVSDVKYDPEMYFTGEEASLAIRYFTHGYDLYHPNINLLYHYYTRKDHSKHWIDHSDHYQYTKKSTARLSSLIHLNSNLGMYGLGKKRTIKQWIEYSGIDYINKKIHKNLLENKEPPFINHENLWINENDLS